MRILVLCFIACLLWSCQKESFTSDAAARLSLYTDTLRFDTVFTQTGSTTRLFKIFNTNGKGVRIESVRLAGGAASPFRINVNGEPGNLIQNVELPAGDSAYVFVSVNINPNAAQLPFLVQDSVEISYSGNRDVVHLQAYGQNAHFVRRRTITANETWTADLPYVILEELTVAQGATLTIERGSNIFVHTNAPLTISGSLIVNGGPDSTDRVRFSGSRLDAPYRNHPGSWPGIRFMAGSSGNKIQYAILQNAQQALLLEANAAGSSASIEVSETIIDAAQDAGIFSQGGNIIARNLQVSNCGKALVLSGGNYLFEHCTIAGYNTRYLLRKEPLLQAGNIYTVNGQQVNAPLDAVFRNCIIWGEAFDVTNEVALTPTSGVGFTALFDHVLWKVDDTPVGATTVNALAIAPMFISAENDVFDFRLQEGSPAIDQGKLSAVTNDLDGKLRPIGPPDLGAYEMQ